MTNIDHPPGALPRSKIFKLFFKNLNLSLISISLKADRDLYPFCLASLV